MFETSGFVTFHTFSLWRVTVLAMWMVWVAACVWFTLWCTWDLVKIAITSCRTRWTRKARLAEKVQAIEAEAHEDERLAA